LDSIQQRRESEVSMTAIEKRMQRVKKRSPPTTNQATVVWGKKLEEGDFLKVPRALLRMHRYQDGFKWLKPRHLLLLLVLASRKFKNKPIRAYWEELADDLGVDRDTVRKWAYELEEKKLLQMKRIRGRDPNNNRVGVRNDRNVFELSNFVEVVEKAWAERRKQRQRFSRGDDDE
jgi:hypothetical protein